MDPPPDGEDMQRFTDEVVDLMSSTKAIRGSVERLPDSQNLNKNYWWRTKARALKVTQKKVEKELAGISVTTHQLKGRVEELNRSNAANRAIMNCGAKSLTDRNRMAATSVLKKDLRETAAAIQVLITIAQNEERLQAADAVHRLLREMHEDFREMGIDRDLPVPLRGRRRLMYEFIETELRKLIDKADAKKDPPQRATTLLSTLRNKINAEVTRFRGWTFTSCLEAMIDLYG